MNLAELIAKLQELAAAGAVHVRIVEGDGTIVALGAAAVSLDNDTGCALIDAGATDQD